MDIDATPIYSWSDGYVALKHRAEDLRGSITINRGTPEWERWPATTGADVIAIAALVDPYMQSLPAAPGHLGVIRRWAECLSELEAIALVAPASTYPENRAFWRTLASIAVHLASIEAPMPTSLEWDALLAQLGGVVRSRNLGPSRDAPRNVGPKGDVPFGPFTGVKTYDDLYFAQFKLLCTKRGEDRMDPEPGAGGASSPIPRTTNSDVISLADYWTKQLGSVKRVDGHEHVKQRWDTAMADVNALARKADPAALYAKNNAFWRALETTAIQIAVADEAPSDWGRMVDAVGHSITNLPENISKAAEALAGGVSTTAGAVGGAAGNVAGAMARGFFAGMKTPLLVGAGLLGAYLLFRNRGDKSEVPS